VQADGFGLRVALDPLRTQVPGHDPALWVKHEQLIVVRAVHQQPQPLLAVSQGCPVGGSAQGEPQCQYGGQQ
jgi:hypothetical protein